MEIKKLADVVVWFDNWIEEIKLDLTEEDMEDDTTIKEFETIKNVILESMERHSVYTSALNADIAAKAAKIELMQKELDGRKAGYVALKTQMDTKYISIEDHNDICKAYESENESLKKQVEYLKKELEAKDEEIKKRYTDVISQSKTICNLKRELDSTIESASYWQGESKKLENYVTDLKKKFGDSRKETIDRNVTIVQLEAQIKNLEKELEEYKDRDGNAKGLLNNNTKEIVELKKAIVKLKKERDSYAEKVYDLFWFNAIDMELDGKKAIDELEKKEDDHGRKGFKEYIKWIVKEEETKYKESWKARLNEELATIFKEEEETEVKGRYPWGAKVRCKKPDGIYCSYSDECHRKPENFNCDFKDDIPCGSDSIE